MSRIAYVNGRYRRFDDAVVHVEDRGFQFADGVYEVIAIRAGRFLDEQGHLDRLAYSLAELEIAWPLSPNSLPLILREVVRRNRVTHGLVYLQITRGRAPRDFKYPMASHPSLVVTARETKPHAPKLLEDGIAVIVVPDIRWKRRDIKSVSLLAQAMGKQQAATQGAFEAWQVDEDGFVTEGCSSSAWIVTQDGVLVSRRASPLVLDGITRKTLLGLAEDLDMPVEQRAFTVEEAYGAREAFLSSASTFVLPITKIGDRVIANGKPGLIGERLRACYLAEAPKTGARAVGG